MSKRLFLLDGHSLAHRAFYALPTTLKNKDGEYTNAIFGFARMLFRLIDNEEPDMLSVAFDKKAPTFRHEAYEEYKADRKKMPDELSPQIPMIKEMLTALQIPIFEKEGYEADDVIGTLARCGEEEGWKVVIVTGDRDALQLVTDNIEVMYTRKGITDITEYNLEKVREKYELEPEKLVDLKGLMGDSSDNIPGVPGIGIKTATKLLKEFDSMDNVLANIDDVSGKKRKENLRKYEEQARMSKKLGKILQDVPLDVDLEQLSFDKLTEKERKKVVELFERFEFKSLIERFKELDEIKEEDIEIEQIVEKSKLNKYLADWQKEEEIALYFDLSDFSNPVESELEQIIIAVNERNIYSIKANNDLLNLLKPILENDDVKKLMLKAKEGIISSKKHEIELRGLSFEPLLAKYLLNPSQKLIEINELYKEELEFEPWMSQIS